jgi:plastocyanin
MASRRTTFITTCAALMLGAGLIGHVQQAPRILLDQPARAVEYQLNRLSNDELVLVERNATDQKYQLVYFALLTRKGLPAQFRDEALAALEKLKNSTRTGVLLEALERVRPEDAAVADKLIPLLLAQSSETLKADLFGANWFLDTSRQPLALRGGYAALMLADGSPDAAWQLASKQEDHLAELIRAIPHIPATGDGAKLRGQLTTRLATTISDGKDAAVTAAALGVIGHVRPDAATFDLLAQAVAKTTDAAARIAAIRSLQAIPEAAWPQTSIAPLARAIITKVGELPATERTEPDTLDVIQFGDRLAAKVTGADGAAIRRDLRALGVQVVRIQTLPEKLSFDVRWFAVEAGKPIQIALVNVDAMPHNLVVGGPGSLEEIGTKGGALPMPTDPSVKPFVPALPLVITATNLLKEGDTERLAFTAPKAPGEYVFVCTFPGHWMRMYGVMLVVDNLDAWEAKPTVPIDPMTKQPFTSSKN